jgi:hypothetical protein
MQPKNTKIALIIGALFLGASGASNADTQSFDVSVTTVADVSVTEVETVDFGANIYPAGGTTCSMIASTLTAITDAKLQIVRGAAVASMTNYGDLSGAGCINGVGTTLGTQPGEYVLSGTTGTDITILVTSVDAGDFTFTPAGFVSSYDGSTTAGDLAVAISAGSAVTQSLAASADVAGTVVDGELVMVLGGTLAIVNTLTSDFAYTTTTFPLNVIY